MSVDNEEQVRRREVALNFAVQHYGLANHARQALPARPQVVMETARDFEKFISTGDIPPAKSRASAS